MRNASRLWLQVAAEIKRESRLLTYVGIAGILIACLVFVIENFGDDSYVSSAEGWVQLFAGNWPNQATDHTTNWFAVFVAFRIMLVVGAISGAWAAFIKLRDITEMNKKKLSTILADRDFAIEMAVLQTFETAEERKARQEKIHKAIQAGAENWLTRYLDRIAPEDAARIRQEILAGEL
jgi:hypothetical protein